MAFAFRSCGIFQIVGGATWLTAVLHLNLRRDLAVEQGRWSYPVESCSSPRVGPTDKCPHPLRAVRPHDRTSMPAKAGNRRSAAPQVQYGNAAADIGGCQVKLLRRPARVPLPDSSSFGLTVLAEIGIVGHLPVVDEPPGHRRKHAALLDCGSKSSCPDGSRSTVHARHRPCRMYRSCASCLTSIAAMPRSIISTRQAVM